MRMQIDGVTYYDKDEVAKLFNCSTRTVRRYQLAGHFEQRKVNRSWFFTEQRVWTTWSKGASSAMQSRKRIGVLRMSRKISVVEYVGKSLGGRNLKALGNALGTLVDKGVIEFH